MGLLFGSTPGEASPPPRGTQEKERTVANLSKLSVPPGTPDQEGHECAALTQADCPQRPKGESMNECKHCSPRETHCERFLRGVQKRLEGAKGGRGSVNKDSSASGLGL